MLKEYINVMKLSDALEWLESQNNDIMDYQESKNVIENEQTYKSNNDNENICLISRQPIIHPITLKCGHTFDYFNIFRELRTNMKRAGIQSGFKCPYCRTSFYNFIPYYEIEDMDSFIINKSKYGSFKNDILKCDYVFKSGKRKGQCCGASAHKFKVGTYCFTHRTRVEKNINNTKTKPNTDNTKVIKCGHLCKNGKPCSRRVSKKYNNEKCGIHGKMLENK